METTPSTCFLRRGLFYSGLKRAHVVVRFCPTPSQRLFPASYRVRHCCSSLRNKRQQAKKTNIGRSTNTNLQPNDDRHSNQSIFSTNGNLHSNEEIISNNSFQVVREGGLSNEKDYNNSVMPVEADIVDSAEEPSRSITKNSTAVDGGEEISSSHLRDLIQMIRNAEKNINLLNQARVCALEDLEKILSEKDSLLGEINMLEMKLAKTGAHLKMAAQEKIHVERLENQLEQLQNEISSRGLNRGNAHDTPPENDLVSSFSQELESFREENMSLKGELRILKDELSSIRDADERIRTLEKERTFLEFSIKELEAKLVMSHEDISKMFGLKSECRSLYEKVEDLQELLNKGTKQADQATLVLQQNQELRKKVDRLEQSLDEANVYKLSSEKMQEHNELMQHKLKLLDERLQRSDEETISYIQQYQESVKEFQDSLNNLKEESMKREKEEFQKEKPWEFWSNLLLMVDGWYLEKKITVDQATMLREKIWNREESICDAYLSYKEKNEHEMISTLLKLRSPTGPRLHVIHIAAEMAPVAKVGGLGDVVTGLGKALQKRGHLVEIVLPKYDCMNYDLIGNLRALEVPFESRFDGRLFKNKIWVGTVEGLPVYFIEPHHPSKFFWRGKYYGEHDDFKRFSYFSTAALELLLQAGKNPDIIHCHDWQTSFVAPLYWDLYSSKGLKSARICFTCHNFEYQGAAPASDLASCGLDVYHLNRPDRMQDNSAHDRVNPLKGAIVFSNIVTTVSPSYALEVRTPEGGRGLHTTLDLHSKKFVGILNGIDTDAWNPATDIFLAAHYGVDDIRGKAENKEALRRQLGLSSANIRQPLVACITRLVPQKGVHLIRHAMYRTLELGGQFVLLGSSPVSHIQREFEDISGKFKSHEHVRLILKYDEVLAHVIYAASDMFIIPSIFEPCGLTQMIAMRYGSIPIVRKTGGLNDSVFDADDDTIPVQFRNGFTFFTADEQGLNNALERAFDWYNNSGDDWEQLVRKDMSIDFGWETSALVYEELYQKTVDRARATNRT